MQLFSESKFNDSSDLSGMSSNEKYFSSSSEEEDDIIFNKN